MGCFAKFIKDRNSKAGNMGVPPYFVFDICSDSGFPHYRFFSWFWFGPPLLHFFFLLIVLRMLHMIGSSCSANLVRIATSDAITFFPFYLRKDNGY